ncbi:MAG: glutamate formiminotransferase [Acidimicrobiales bacterium]|jgi:glutamate formiminotransferase
MAEFNVLEAVINVSEGRDPAVIAEIGRASGPLLLDVHSDRFHHRSVFTLAGSPAEVEASALGLARRAVELLDLTSHVGVHPRLGVVDVVPFVPYGRAFSEALAARDRFAHVLAGDGVPCFLYGPERTLPEVRRQAFVTLAPDLGPIEPHPTAGACCVGARDVLIAYNLVIDGPLSRAKEIARGLRAPAVRALGLAIGAESQVSFNLIDPTVVGPAQIYDQVAALAPIERAELVGLVPGSVLAAIPPSRLRQLGLARESTIEARLQAGRAS